MADVYCNDGGSNTSPYETWAKAATTLAVALAHVSAGDNIWVQSDHMEDTNAQLTMSTAGTSASPIRIVSVTNLNEPPTNGDFETMVAGGGKISNISGNHDMIFGAGDNIWDGLYFEIGDDLKHNIAGVNRFHNCKFSVNDNIWFGEGNSGAHFPVYWENCDYDQVTDGQWFFSGGQLDWQGGILTTTGSFLTSMMEIQATQASKILVRDVDLSALDVDDYLLELSSVDKTRFNAVFLRCKLPNFTTGGLLLGAINDDNGIIKFLSCSDEDIIYQLQENYLTGQINEDTNVYLDATYDGTHGYSYKLVSNTYAKEWSRPLKFKLADVYVDATGKVLTVEVLTDNVTLQNDEFWIEVEYPDSVVAAFGNVFSTRSADILATPANLTASSKGAGDWTGESGTPVYQKVVADFTGVADEAVGVYTVWACLAKPSTTVYVCPKVVVV